RRRIEMEHRRLQLEHERNMAEAEERIRIDLDAEVAQHASALDDALITCYNSGIPIRQIALSGFGNRYDGGVHQLLRELRADGRIGNREGYQRNTADPVEVTAEVKFPEPLDLETALNAVVTISDPTFTLL